VKLKIKLSVMMIAIVVIVAGGIAIIELQRASAISLDLSKRSIAYLADLRSQYWNGRIGGYLEVLHTAADVFSHFEDTPVADRRNEFGSFMRAIMENQPDFIRMFTVWKPNSLDNDASYIGRPGTTPTGQVAFSLTRESGQIQVITSTVVNEVMEHINGPNAHKDNVNHPGVMRVAGKDVYAVRIIVPIRNARTNEIVGGVGCQLNIDLVQPRVENTIATFEEVAAISMYSSNGFILASYRPERIGKMFMDAEVQFGQYAAEAFEALKAGKKYQCFSYAPALGTNIQIAMSPIDIGTADTKWAVMVGSTEDFIMKEVNQMTEFVVILASIAIVVAVVVIYLALSHTTKPIITVSETLRDISEGEGDLTKRISTYGKDEVGDLSRYFNLTLEKIKNLVLLIKKQSTVLSDIGHDLSSNMTETAAAINQITANIHSIKGRVINQSASVTQTNATMEQVITNINKLNNHIENQSNNISQASSAIEEMVANINSVTSTLISNTNNVSTLKEASEVGRNGLQDVASDIQEISRESEGLLEINAVMENIASQTNLLSMNAAIEAAHAGEAGKGFAVVADEIRKLAESSSEQSKTIGTVLKKISESISKITKSTENVLTKFEAIDSGVKTVSQQEENIRNSMEEQGEGSKQVLQSVGGLNELTQLVKSGSEEMLSGSKEVMTESQNLEKATQEITGGMNEMSSGAEQINVAVHNVSEMTVKNREAIDALIKEVSRFKVD
jgi:methyl-accepting chemotaxis protein